MLDSPASGLFLLKYEYYVINWRSCLVVLRKNLNNMISDISRVRTFELRIKKEPQFSLFDSGVYINCLRTYYAYYGVIPSYKVISGLDYLKAINWVETTLRSKVIQKHQKENHCADRKKMECENVLYLLESEILIDIEDNGVVCVLYKTGNEKKAQEIAEKISAFKKRRKIEPKISIVTSSAHGLELTSINCPKPKLQIERNYNDDLQGLHKDIVKFLSNDNRCGLILFHGMPGTGKSTYIRYLISSVRKKFIFLSPRLAGSLDTPNFVSLLIENRNSVLVIEDAEELLVSREKNANSAISILLNLTDGILGESLGIQTICTFNTQTSNIDEALLRKGRLTAMYEFRELSVDKANRLLKGNGSNHIASKPMTLSDIYNTDKPGFSIAANRMQIGFKVA